MVCVAISRPFLSRGDRYRDRKPDNLFLVERSEEPPLVKRVDFGTAKTLGIEGESIKLTRTGTLVGTPFYMAPEQTKWRQSRRAHRTVRLPNHPVRDVCGEAAVRW